MQTCRQERAALLQEISETSKQLDDMRIRVSQLTARKKTIEEMEHNYEGYNGAVRYIMKAAPAGIEGVVGDLMKAPAGYETALETALGGAMQNIVCRKDAHAKEAIRMLKMNKAGRLTFLPMESVKGSAASVPGGVRQHAGYLGIGAELAVYAPQYQGVFTYLLGRVAIVDNMDSAIALSKIAGSGLRFVTLDGEVINAGGAITGGRYKMLRQICLPERVRSMRWQRRSRRCSRATERAYSKISKDKTGRRKSPAACSRWKTNAERRSWSFPR